MFTVITKVPNPLKGGGNLANGPELYRLVKEGTSENFFEDAEYEPLYEYINRLLEDGLLDKHFAWEISFATSPVFKQGEILILDESDRDQFGRKPSKWFIECESFDNAVDAAACAKRVAKED